MEKARRRYGYDIYIVGLGLSVGHITREVEAALRQSKEILYLSSGYGVSEYLAKLCPKITNLSTFYKVSGSRLATYNAITAATIDAALKDSPVALALYGNPMVFAFPTQQIRQISSLFDLRVKIFPGISALDTILIDINLDPGTQGLQIYEATDLILYKRPIQTDVPCLILQVGAIESALHSNKGNRPERFHKILTYLLNYYPPEHSVSAVFSSMFPLAPAQVTTFMLKDMEGQHEKLHHGRTLYLPPVAARPIADYELLDRIYSVEHLRKITYQP